MPVGTQRKTVHNFIPGRRIPRADLERLLGLACLAPSSWNLQPWRFVVVEDAAKRAEIRAMAWDQPIVTDSAAVIITLGHTDPHRTKKRIFDQWRANGIIDDAVHAQWMEAVGHVYPTDDEKHEFAIRNSTFAAMTLMLAAHAMGLATCPMIGFDKKALTAYLGVKDGWVVSFMMACGYAGGDEKFPRQQRFGLDEIAAFL